MNLDLERYKISHPASFKIADFDPDERSVEKSQKSNIKDLMKSLNDELEILQEKLYAESKHKILIILQGMDASGKDGTVRHVFEGVNPQGVDVVSFKSPSKLELAHDYLWRIHHNVPAVGQIVIFNRSHYEDVLIARVKQLVPESVWQNRFDHINNFEKMLVDEGVTILKFFLHISKEEQKIRLMERLDDEEKHWKFNPDDIKERSRWNDYMAAYQDMIQKTSTAWAPWTIIPANRKWIRNYIVAHHIVKFLKDLKIQLPMIDFPPETYQFE
ncbi:MAG: polyphosphate kinase 2 family protein [Anaerolineaceae bacterium]|nr:polyphosphate kinase 2 family protein [Anaerolineaceae bacterium]